MGQIYSILAKPRTVEMPVTRLLLLFAAAAAVGAVVWRLINSTVIKRQRDELRQAKEEAKRASTARFIFLANISNELRTPINTIMGMNEMAMREDAEGVPKAYFMSMMNYAFDIRNASEALLSLINDLMDMSRIESGELRLAEQEYDTVEMIRSVIPTAKARSSEKGLDLDISVDEMLPGRMFGDYGKIRQIVLNLLSNAVKYTDAGRVVFTVSIEEREDEECKLRFSVKDTGRGIKQENIEKLFTAYEHLDKRDSSVIIGTGLGLDISRRFADLLGGSLVCESVYGKGSEFILTVTQKITDQTPIGVFTEQEDSSLKGRYAPLFIAPGADILVVSGDHMTVTVIKGLLKATEVFVSTAASGEECLEIIKNTGFDIVFIDNTLPGMDGVEVVSEIRGDHPRLPVYALSANTGASEEYFRAKGFTGYLSKPVDGMALERVIMDHLPEEMMERKTRTDDTTEAIGEIPPDMLWLFETEGISVPEGIKNSRGIASYLFGLDLFLDTIDQNAKTIMELYESGDIRLYTIKIHALKRSARLIGAVKLSELAAALEDAGNRGDRTFIDANNEKLLSEYEAFKDRLERLHAAADE